MSAAVVGLRPGAVGAVLLLTGAFVVHGLASARRRAVLAKLGSGQEDPGPRWRRAVEGVGDLVPVPPPSVLRRLRRTGVTEATAVRLWRGSAVAVVAVVGVAWSSGGLGAVVLALLLLTLGVGLALVAAGDRVAVLVDRELPGVLASVAAGVRSGASLSMAVREGSERARGPAAEDLGVVVDALAAGQGLAEALQRWTRSRPTPGVRMTCAALTLAAETGGAGARTIDGVASTLRDRLAVDRELAALSSQARASAVVIGVAPVGFVALTALSDPGVWDFFLRTPLGTGCLALGCLLDGVGAAWMVLVARGAR